MIIHIYFSAKVCISHEIVRSTLSSLLLSFQYSITSISSRLNKKILLLLVVLPDLFSEHHQQLSCFYGLLKIDIDRLLILRV